MRGVQEKNEEKDIELLFGRGGNISRAFNAVKWNYNDVLIAMQMLGALGKTHLPCGLYFPSADTISIPWLDSPTYESL